jgi:hypothetical protein
MRVQTTPELCPVPPDAATAGIALLMDTSGSMLQLAGSRTRIDVARDIWNAVTPTAPGALLVAFDSIPHVLKSGERLPDPAGGTALHLALELVAPFRPRKVIVISDGSPDNPGAALAAARALDCEIAAYFCGDDCDHGAVAFMRALGWASSDGLGHMAVADLRKPEQLTNELRLLLDAPER